MSFSTRSRIKAELLVRAHSQAQSIQLFAPTNGYFPDGAVRHEVLHARRFHVDGAPKRVLSNSERWDKGFSNALGSLDNAIEHVVIAPEELQFHPDRREHWEKVMQDVWSELPYDPEDERPLAVCLHWTFLRHVLPDSPVVEIARSFVKEHALWELAEHFADQFKAVVASKEKLVRLLFDTFPKIPKHRAALEYINSMTELPRVLRRLQPLREWSPYEQAEQVFPRGP